MRSHKGVLGKTGAAAALAAVLVTTVCAFGLVLFPVTDNYLETGYVKADIVFAESAAGRLARDVPCEPGMRIRRDVTVTNVSVGDDESGADGIWYRVYFTGVSGKLAEVLEAIIYDGDKILASATVEAWTDNRLLMEGQPLGTGESKTLTLELYFPETAGNAYQGGSMEYRLAVDAVQRRNNPDREFGNG